MTEHPEGVTILITTKRDPDGRNPRIEHVQYRDTLTGEEIPV